MKYRFSIILCLLLISISCRKDCIDGSCELADLTGEVDAPSYSILAGNNFDYEHIVENLEAASCTRRACRSTTITTVRYEPSGRDTLVKTDETTVRELEAGEENFQPYKILFKTKGTYLITAIADGQRNVEERDENNNTNKFDASGNRLGWRPEEGILVHVLQDSLFSDTNEMVVILKGEPR